MIVTARHKAGLTQTQLAARLAVTVQTAWRLEKGECGIRVLYAAAKLLKIPMDRLIVEGK